MAILSLFSYGRKERGVSTNKNKVTIRVLKGARYAAGEPRYRHPTIPSLTWSGGRGRKPSWVKVLLEEGYRLSDLEIKDDDKTS